MEDKSIKLLAQTNNHRGDLFTRLAKDIFFALGYDELRLDVHKSGRELDLQGQHRFEPRRVIAECKAHVEKIGGSDLNKFFGALARERKVSPVPIAGYCVSLSGFTETGIEQELTSGDDKIILIDAKKMVIELERCRVIVNRTDASERAGHCAANSALHGATLDGSELLVHDRGYVWAIFYSHGKERTHLALIHADGTPLGNSIAQELIQADRGCGGTLYTLKYVPPPLPALDRANITLKAHTLYLKWLSEECGYIHLDGLPADADLSATRLKLERLFVPLKAIYLSTQKNDSSAQQKIKSDPISIGKILSDTQHLALLALPGGGKSTLLKRLAIAYAFPERRQEVSDGLPQRDWLPLILRCRELRDRAQRPIIELVGDVPRHAGLSTDEYSCFLDFSHAALRDGHVLLLVDGLDEISDEGARQTFADHLRTFVATFPQIAVVVTSREAGFRLIAGVIAGAFDRAKLAPLDENDVLQLCERWHAEVLGNTEKIKSEAKQLAQTIWGNERIRILTENPLLLTTLLVVRRWIGELPRNRTALYREAIRVLVRTWNVEGYAPLDEDETLAQLSYVACAMLFEGKQQIGQKKLLKHLQNARREMEAELQFTRISPQEFVERIEFRSSLLMQSGFERINGSLQPLYEFRHLTFQEYLAARGLVEEQYPGRNHGQGVSDLLEPHFQNENWQEVIPLAAVLLGRKAEELVKRLITKCKSPNPAKPTIKKQVQITYLNVLNKCIHDEVQVTAPTLKTALLLIARDRSGLRELDRDAGTVILRGKFGSTFQEVVESSYLESNNQPEEFIAALADVAGHLQHGNQNPHITQELAASLLQNFQKESLILSVRAALVCMQLAFQARSFRLLPGSEISYYDGFFDDLSPFLQAMAFSNDLRSILPACWALAWIGRSRLSKVAVQPELFLHLYNIWRKFENKKTADLCCWALAEQQLLPRETFDRNSWGDCDDFLRNYSKRNLHWGAEVNRYAVCAVGWYRRAPWSDEEIVELLRTYVMDQPRYLPPTVCELLTQLGESGRKTLEDWNNRHPDRAVEA